MFRSYQIMTATKLLKNFPRVLSKEQQAILIITKSEDNFVLLNAELYEELLNLKYENIENNMI